ncbi:calcium-dependent protein kinase SK5 [Artemisia annua]|uniref:Calcium-dependent protein kinase SK5 n=1 Tax=Artemisia annua TaxID=35608 RepID=A0A2U1KFP8_ARTAN|nr:calcium-dependent protein kinase SK5 [Artemisia annua]
MVMKLPPQVIGCIYDIFFGVVLLVQRRKLGSALEKKQPMRYNKMKDRYSLILQCFCLLLDCNLCNCIRGLEIPYVEVVKKLHPLTIEDSIHRIGRTGRAEEPGSNEVVYWAENSETKYSSVGTIVTYKYYNYNSTYIHHCTIIKLEVLAETLSEEEIGGLKELFKLIDTKKSGTITIEEMKEGMRRVSSDLLESEIKDLMDAVSIYFPLRFLFCLLLKQRCKYRIMVEI